MKQRQTDWTIPMNTNQLVLVRGMFDMARRKALSNGEGDLYQDWPTLKEALDALPNGLPAARLETIQRGMIAHAMKVAKVDVPAWFRCARVA